MPELRMAVAWQDSLLSLCFDRPSAIIAMNMPNIQTNFNGIPRTYIEAMYCMIEGVNRGVNAVQTSRFDTLIQVVAEIENIFPQAQSHLQTLETCANIQQRCEFYALRLHVSFAIAWICRGSVRKRSTLPEVPANHKVTLASKFKHYLVEGLRAFLKLQPLCMLASRSWAFVHNGLSSALLLGLLGETRANSEVRELQGQLIDVLSSNEGTSSRIVDSESSVTLSRLHSRALSVLKNLYNEQRDASRPNSARLPVNPQSTGAVFGQTMAENGTDMMSNSVM
jgi:hypothetical protein